MEATERTERVIVSVIELEPEVKYAIMISFRDNHSLLPWTYPGKSDAITDADNFVLCLQEHHFTEVKPDLETSFDLPIKADGTREGR